jgi:hypothetical protein
LAKGAMVNCRWHVVKNEANTSLLWEKRFSGKFAARPNEASLALI